MVPEEFKRPGEGVYGSSDAHLARRKEREEETREAGSNGRSDPRSQCFGDARIAPSEWHRFVGEEVFAQTGEEAPEETVEE